MATVINQLPQTDAPLGPIEYLELTWEERCKPRRKFVTSNGTELVLSLPRGSTLTEGMIVYNCRERTVIVKAKSEQLLIIEPSTPLQFCQVAHNLGNWHRSMQVKGDRVLTHADAPLKQWLNRHRIRFHDETQPYQPNLCSHAHD